MVETQNQIEYFGEQKKPNPSPSSPFKVGMLVVSSQWRVEATKRQKEIVGQSVSTNFFYFHEKLFHQFVHIIELTQQREKNRFSLKFGLSANWAVSQRFKHPRVLGIPIPISLAFWASPSHITAAFWTSPGTLPGCPNP